MKYLALIAALSLAACGNGAKLGTADYADAAATAAVVAQGGMELNPLIGAAGNAAAPVVSLGVKYVGQAALIEYGMEPDEARRWTNAAGWLGACNNILQALVPIDLAASVTVGLICAIVSWEKGNIPEGT